MSISRWLHASAVALLVALTVSTFEQARGANAVSESDVKAALTYKIAKFVTWPGTVDGNTLTLCHIGSARSAQSFRALAGRRVGDRAIQLRTLADHERLSGCHALFVAREEEADALPIIRDAADKPVLTIGESEAFATRLGGIIALRTDAKRVRFDVNVAASQRANLRISAQLLSVANLVQEAASPNVDSNGAGRATGTAP